MNQLTIKETIYQGKLFQACHGPVTQIAYMLAKEKLRKSLNIRSYWAIDYQINYA